MEQNVDIPAVGGKWNWWRSFWFSPRTELLCDLPSRSLTIQFLGRKVLEIHMVFLSVDREGSTAFFELIRRSRWRSSRFFSQSRAPQRLLRFLLDKLVKGFYALFPHRKKVRRSRAPWGRNWVRTRAHGLHELSCCLVPLVTTLTAALTSCGTTWGAVSSPCC